jgi:hypothetical protein
MRQACITTARTRWALEHHLDLTEAVYAEVHAELNHQPKVTPQTLSGASSGASGVSA